MPGRCQVHDSHPANVNSLLESFPNGPTSLPWSHSCWRSIFTSSLLMKTDWIALVGLGGKDEKCSRRGWGNLVERAKSLETVLDLILFLSTYYHLCGLGQVSSPPWTCFFICKDDVLLWRLNYSTCETPGVEPVAEQMLSRWSSVSSIPWPSPVDRVPLLLPVLSITVTLHIPIILLPPGAPQFNF